MVEIERSPGQGVRIGPYTLRVVAVHPDRVEFALRGPESPLPGAAGSHAGLQVVDGAQGLVPVPLAQQPLGVFEPAPQLRAAPEHQPQHHGQRHEYQRYRAVKEDGRPRPGAEQGLEEIRDGERGHKVWASVIWASGGRQPPEGSAKQPSGG